MCKYWMFLFFSNCAFSLTTLVVEQNSDSDPGGFGNSGDLRWCINTMNEGLNSSADDYVITFDFPMTIQLQGLLPIINNSSHPVNITIGPTGSMPVIIDGDNGAYGGLFIPMGNVTIQNMTFQNLTAKGGHGGDGISGGGGGLGAGGAIYLPQTFLNGSYPNVILKNVLINNCSAEGGNGGNGINSLTGDEGGGGGGGFYGNGGSIEASGSTGGGGGGGFGGDGGNVTLSGGILGGGGGGGGGIGSKAVGSSSQNLGHGGSDQSAGLDGNGYGLSVIGGAGAGGYLGGSNAGGGGGGGASGSSLTTGGGGGGSDGFSGQQPLGTTPPGGSSNPSGGSGRDGGGGGGGAVVIQNPSNNGIDGKAGTGGYGGGGGGGAGTGSYETFYSVEGGGGGIGGGGGGGGVNFSGFTPANGGNSLGGGGGGGGGPSLGVTALGGADNGALGGGSGGDGSNRPIGVVVGYGGGGGGGGSALGPAIFVDSGLSLTIQAFDGGIPTNFNTLNNTVTAGSGGNGGPNAQDGFSGSSLSAPIFLRSGAVLNLVAENSEDLLILGEGVSFADGSIFGGGGSSIMVKGNGTVIYQGSTDYTGSIAIHNANLNLQGVIDGARVQVCRNLSIGPQRGMLSGSGTITGPVFVNSGAISPDEGQTLTLGSLQLSPANPISDTLGSLVHININVDGPSVVHVSGDADLHGVLEMEIAADTPINSYTIFSSSNLTGTFDQVVFTGTIPYYGLSYLPIAAPTYVQFDFLGFPSSTIILPTNGLSGNNLKVAQYLNELADDPNLGLNQQLSILEDLPFKEYEEALESISPSRIAIPTFAAQNVMFMLSEAVSFDLTKKRLARHEVKKPPLKEMALLASNDLYSGYSPSHRLNKTGSSNTSQIWTMGFGQFGHQNSQEQTPGFDFNSGGLFVAYDYGNIDQGYIGALSGYAHISIEDSQSQGSSELNAGYISLYGTGYFSDFFLDTSLWGQYMHVDQKRKIGYSSFTETATSDFNAAQFNVHMGMGYDFNRKTLTFEPFALADIVFEWDGSYQEKGTGPYNMQIDSRKSWMLRFETGFNGYKTVNFNHGVFIAQTKLSYVYKKPHNVGQVNAAIVNAPIGFSVESFSSCQNLVSPGIELFWKTDWNGYMSLSYNGEFGSGYRSNQFYGKIGYAF